MFCTFDLDCYIYSDNVIGVDCVKLQVLKPYEIENKATQPVSYVVGITQGNCLYKRFLPFCLI
jgi:hypothetical protein